MSTLGQHGEETYRREETGEQEDQDVHHVRPEREEGLPHGVQTSEAGEAEEGGREDGTAVEGGGQECKVSATRMNKGRDRTTKCGSENQSQDMDWLCI